jgi:hypothetical protein
MKHSHCSKISKIKYKNVATSTLNSPCSNVLISCALCPAKVPAVWKYYLAQYLDKIHNGTSNEFASLWTLKDEEIAGMKLHWRRILAP